MKGVTKAKYFLYFVFFLVLFFILGGYAYYLYKYPKPPDVKYLLEYYPEDLILKTGGWLEPPNRRLQHFLNFSLSKKKGTIRIGTFGDSFTYGNEVDKTETYPYQLQQLFNKVFPNKKIEVLNFGIPGGGLKGQFLLWEKYAKSYGLDYILFGPRGFYADRDLTFRKNWGHITNFTYPWERFILSNDDVKLKRVHVKGNTLEERYKNYYKLIPSWTALRYDKEPFQIWRIFSPSLKYIPNPFYYRKMSDEEESIKINTLLLEKINKSYNKRILFFTDDQDLFDNYSSVGSDYNLNLIGHKENLFYKMFDHKSSLGNELIANIYFNALIGKAEFFLDIIGCYLSLTPKKRLPPKKEVKFEKNLDQVKSIKITSKNISLFTLVQNSSDHDHYQTKRSYFKNKVKGTKSFIGFSNKSDFLKFPYFPLPIELKNRMKIYIQSGHNKIELGEIEPFDTFNRFFVFYEDFIERKTDSQYSYYESYFLLEKMLNQVKKELEKENSLLELFVEDYKLGHLEFYNLYGRKSLRFIPVNGYEKSFLLMGPSHRVRKSNFPSELLLSIEYNTDDGEIFQSSIPDWNCKKKRNKFVLNLPNFTPLKLR